MSDPVVHFEIIGPDPAALRAYYGQLFGWGFDTSAPVADAVSEPDDYGFVEAAEGGIPGGVGGGASFAAQTVFYVGVADVGRALDEAERLGGTRVFGPQTSPTGLVMGQFTDPAGNLVGVAAPQHDSAH